MPYYFNAGARWSEHSRRSRSSTHPSCHPSEPSTACGEWLLKTRYSPPLARSCPERTAVPLRSQEGPGGPAGSTTLEKGTRVGIIKMERCHLMHMEHKYVMRYGLCYEQAKAELSDIIPGAVQPLCACSHVRTTCRISGFAHANSGSATTPVPVDNEADGAYAFAGHSLQHGMLSSSETNHTLSPRLSATPMQST